MAELFQDPNLTQPDQSGLALAPGQNVPGVGLAPAPDQGTGMSTPDPLRAAVNGLSAPEVPPVSRRQSVADAVRAKVEGMSGLQKVGALLGEFGAGVTGKTSPLRQGVEDERKNRLLENAENRESLMAFTKGLDALNSIPDADTRASVAAKMAPHMGEFGDAFLDLSNKPGDSAKLTEYSQNSPTLKMILQTQGPKGASAALKNEGMMKTIMSEIDMSRLPVVQQKAKTLLAGAQQIDPKVAEQIQARGYATHADILSLNDAAKSNPALSQAVLNPADMSVLNGHTEAAYAGVPGMVGPKSADAIKAKKLEATDTPFMKESQALQKLVDEGNGDSQQAKDLRAHLAKMDSPTSVMVSGGQGKAPAGYRWINNGTELEPIPGGPARAASGIDPKTRDFYATQSIAGDNSWQSGLARGREGQALIAAVKDRIPQMAEELGLSPQDVGTNKATNVALSRTLTDRQKYSTAVEQLQGTLQKQGELVKSLLAKGAGPSGSPVLNRWIQAGRQEIAGDTDVNNLNIALTGLSREHQRVLTSPLSNAQLHASSQETGDNLVNKAKTPEQILGAIATMNKEAANGRAQAEQTIKETQDKLRALGGRRATDNPAPQSAPQTQDAYREKFGKPPPSVGNKDGFDKLKSGEGYIDSRDGKYKVKG